MSKHALQIFVRFSCLCFLAFVGTYGSRAQGADTLPTPWQSTVIGDAAPSGSVSYGDGSFTLSASGADVQDIADAFRFTD
ncbi:MAG: hypothetical protein ACRYFS_19350 [Janthinobacterium lividum]